jgi:GNAT superfamily N-acetyltransferase
MLVSRKRTKSRITVEIPLGELTAMLTDIELARRLEEAEAYAAEACARESLRRHPRADVVIEDIAGGRAVFMGPGSPLTECKGIGLYGPVSDDDLDRMEAIFFSRNEQCRIVVCPMADSSFIEGLGRRGYQLARFENMLAMPLGNDVHETRKFPGIEVRPIEPGEADLYAKVVAPNFVGAGELSDDLLELMGTMLGAEHAVSFLALIDREPVGGGMVLIHRGMALFAGAATLPPFRNRGVHAALHQARLAYAIRAGCNLAAQGAEPGSTSERNAERRGLYVAYTRAILVRDAS